MKRVSHIAASFDYNQQISSKSIKKSAHTLRRLSASAEKINSIEMRRLKFKGNGWFWRINWFCWWDFILFLVFLGVVQNFMNLSYEILSLNSVEMFFTWNIHVEVDGIDIYSFTNEWITFVWNKSKKTYIWWREMSTILIFTKIRIDSIHSTAT